MAKKKVSFLLEKEDFDTLMAFSRAKKMNLSETCRLIIRDKLLSDAVDIFSKASMIEKRIYEIEMELKLKKRRKGR